MKDEFKSVFEKEEIMFDVILEEQTPLVQEIENPKEWIESNKKLINSFLEYAKTKTNAIGLAANQISKGGERFMERMFCSRAKGDSDGPWKVYINPKIVKIYGELQPRSEGCFNWPKKKVLAQRYLRIDVEWYTPHGVKKEAELKGWEAQVWQHEQDHLDGVEEEIASFDHLTVRSNKIGRNEPCPCGKMKDGKPVKYKRCCAGRR